MQQKRNGHAITYLCTHSISSQHDDKLARKQY